MLGCEKLVSQDEVISMKRKKRYLRRKLPDIWEYYLALPLGVLDPARQPVEFDISVHD